MDNSNYRPICIFLNQLKVYKRDNNSLVYPFLDKILFTQKYRLRKELQCSALYYQSNKKKKQFLDENLVMLVV